jgi:hypothetical protein
MTENRIDFVSAKEVINKSGAKITSVGHETHTRGHRRITHIYAYWWNMAPLTVPILSHYENVMVEPWGQESIVVSVY